MNTFFQSAPAIIQAVRQHCRPAGSPLRLPVSLHREIAVGILLSLGVLAPGAIAANTSDPASHPSQSAAVTSLIPDLPPLGDAAAYLPGSLHFNGYGWPAQGVITSGYGWRWGRMHRGLDIAAPTGTPILAAAPGTVIAAGWSSGGYGNYVDIRHGDGSLTRYAHASRLYVRSGQRVRQGELIAAIGSTGRSTGPHLHFEIRRADYVALNPMPFLRSGNTTIARMNTDRMNTDRMNTDRMNTAAFATVMPHTAAPTTEAEGAGDQVGELPLQFTPGFAPRSFLESARHQNADRANAPGEAPTAIAPAFAGTFFPSPSDPQTDATGDRPQLSTQDFLESFTQGIPEEGPYDEEGDRPTDQPATGQPATGQPATGQTTTGQTTTDQHLKINQLPARVDRPMLPR
jgi:hypothetical protein